MTRGGVRSTSTTLTLSDTWLTTQTSPALRTATATGSMPTFTEPLATRPAGVTRRMSSEPFGVLATNSRAASADSATGRTGPLSNVRVAVGPPGSPGPSGGASSGGGTVPPSWWLSPLEPQAASAPSSTGIKVLQVRECVEIDNRMPTTWMRRS